jgi:hypothetical protein
MKFLYVNFIVKILFYKIIMDFFSIFKRKIFCAPVKMRSLF